MFLSILISIFQIGEVDILAIPAKDPVKFCLQAMDVLFSREEMSKGRYKAVRQRGDRTKNPPLDPLKVRIIDGNSKLDAFWCTMS